MAEDRRPPLPSLSESSTLGEGNYQDPFADRPRALNFQEPPIPRPYDSQVSLPHEFGGHGGYDDDESEKIPLPSQAGGLYPPA